MLNSIDTRRPPKRAVVVTFDDGYADNFLNARPLLEQFDIPAAVFVASGYLNSRGFWWDELDAVLLRPGLLPGTLRLNVSGKTCEWDLGDSVDYNIAQSYENRRWRPWKSETPTARHKVYRELYQLMHSLTDDERQQVREDLLTWAGESHTDPNDRVLSSRELSELARDGLIEIGSHTVMHPRLSSLSAKLQEDEISRSRADLEEVLEREVASFAYPYGQSSDYNASTISLLKKQGFRCAFSAENGKVHTRTDRFQLPRVQVSDVDGDTFDRQLREWVRS
jgi:peptidoglycan/xylan/chitin deacetylase (PgdA/CDA1 family)